MSPRGRLHILLVYAEMEFDSTFQKLDPCAPEGHWQWKAGKMPLWKDKLISKSPDGDALMTKYFRQASFGEFQVTGDYLDTLITLKITDVRNRNGKVVTQEAFGNNLYRMAVLKKVNAIENPKFAFGSEMDDFDRWTFARPGQEKTEEENGKIDLVMLIWRNIHVANLGNHAGFVTPGNFGNVLGKQTDMYSIFRTGDHLPQVICRHEFSHMLYGGNNFHTANGGVGTRMFIPTVGGYSNMSASDAVSQTWNGWDRERMGWQHPDNDYIVNAVCAETGEDVNGELEYGKELCGDGTFILRDFASKGDVLKIKLPHLPDTVRNQYLWLENHQLKEGFLDHDKGDPKGLYGYLQVGKDIREGRGVFGDNCNYLWPLSAHGNYDFELTGEGKRCLHMKDSRQNPLTGYNYLMRIVNDKDGDGKIRITQDIRPKTEYTLPNVLVCNHDTMPKEYFSYQRYPIFGTQDVAWKPDGYNKIGISENPAPTPVYTYSNHRGPTNRDNRRIYLNGISVEVLDVNRKGDMRVKVRWDDYDIDRHVRWCGNILSKEKIFVKEGASVTLDQGYSPQVAAVVQKIDGEPVFVEPTVLELAAGSELRLEEFGKLWVKKGSSLLIRKGARVEIGKNASIEVEPGAYVYIEDGAEIDYGHRTARINVRSENSGALNPLVANQFKGLEPVDDRF